MGNPRALLPQGTSPKKEEMLVSQDAKVMELLALLVLGREFFSPEGIRQGSEVLRDWLAAAMFPDLFTEGGNPQAAREKVRYHRDKLQTALQIHRTDVRPVTGERRRERNVVSVIWDNVWIDVLALREAAKQSHSPDKQQEIITLGGRPLLEGMTYPWLQEPWFQKVRAELDTYFLTALCRQTDRLVVQMEKANETGRLTEADACRSKALPLLDRAAERLSGYGEQLRQPEDAALLPLEAQFSELRRRAAYPLPKQDARGVSVLMHNLPSPVTSFVGREQEKQEIQDLLTRGRLVTLIGMGGCGKTRLAVQAAWEMLGNWQNVCLVEMAGIADPDRVTQAVAAALGLMEQHGVALEDAVIAFLQQKRTLLLLDNCEHLLVRCASLAAHLLRSCPTLSVLATSREPMNIAGEHLCQVLPLSFPSSDFSPAAAMNPVAALLHYDAARLFVERALQFRRFTLRPENVPPIAAICATLDGIPLALELAAARVQALPLEQIAEMLSDRFGLLANGRRDFPARHKTMRSVIDWSYDLLSKPEQDFLRRLSVFAGGWTLDAAEAVGDLEKGSALALLSSLIDKSMVVADLTVRPGRYRMLETVRQYAEDAFREIAGRDETCSRHRAHFLSLAEEAALHLRGPEPGHWLDRLETEIANFRVALGWRADEPAARLACALTRFWLTRGYQQEGRQWLIRTANAEGVSKNLRANALNCAGSLAFGLGDFQEAQRLHQESLSFSQVIDDTTLVAESLNRLGGVAAHLGDYNKAKALIEQSLTLRRQIGDEAGIADCLGYRAMVANYQCDYDIAKARLEESLTILRRFNDVQSIANCLNNLGIVAYYQNNDTAAQAYFEESLIQWRSLRDKYSIAKSLNGLGEIAMKQGDYEAAEQMYAESLELRQQSGDKYGVANSLNGLGEVASARGDLQTAFRLVEEGLAVRRQIGDVQSIAHSLHNLGEIALRQCRFSESRGFLLSSLQMMRENGDQYGIAHSLESLAAVAVALKQAALAARLLGAAEALRVTINSPRSSSTQQEHQNRAAAMHALLEEAATTAAWAEGQAMNWEQAVAFALEENTPNPNAAG